MSVEQFLKVGVCAAGLSCLMLAGFAQAQSQPDDHTKPVQYADQDTGEPLNADQTHQNQTNRAAGGERRTTNFRGPEAAGSNERGATASVDHYIANCLLMKNRGEIEINEFAQGRAQKENVKEFAKQMVEDHRRLGEKLERLAQRERGSSDAAIGQLLDIDRQITEKCGQMTRATLEEAPEGEFDKCFVGQQVGAHIGMLAALDVIADQTQGELQQTAEDAKATVKQHLEHAEQLMKELDSSDSRQARADR
jgi:predicted outer membrane protein